MPIQILAVDDSATMRRALAITFAVGDFDLTGVATAEDALKRARAHRPDVAILDAGLAGMNGYDLCAAFRAEESLRGITVILLTSHFAPYDPKRGAAAGVDAAVVKPFDSQVLLDKVAELQVGSASAPAPAAPAAVEGKAAPPPAAPPSATIQPMEIELDAEMPEPGEEGGPPSMTGSSSLPDALRPADFGAAAAAAAATAAPVPPPPAAPPALAKAAAPPPAAPPAPAKAAAPPPAAPPAPATPPPAAPPKPATPPPAAPPASPKAAAPPPAAPPPAAPPKAATPPPAVLAQAAARPPRPAVAPMPPAPRPSLLPGVPVPTSGSKVVLLSSLQTPASVRPPAPPPASPAVAPIARITPTTRLATAAPPAPPPAAPVSVPGMPVVDIGMPDLSVVPPPPAGAAPPPPAAPAGPPPAPPAPALTAPAAPAGPPPAPPAPALTAPAAPAGPPAAPAGPPAAPPVPALAASAAAIAEAMKPALAQAVDAKVAAIAARGPEYAAIATLSREVIEQIAWEVVPELAEVIIRAELDRLVSERGERK